MYAIIFLINHVDATYADWCSRKTLWWSFLNWGFQICLAAKFTFEGCGSYLILRKIKTGSKIVCFRQHGRMISTGTRHGRRIGEARNRYCFLQRRSTGSNNVRGKTARYSKQKRKSYNDTIPFVCPLIGLASLFWVTASVGPDVK